MKLTPTDDQLVTETLVGGVYSVVWRVGIKINAHRDNFFGIPFTDIFIKEEKINEIGYKIK